MTFGEILYTIHLYAVSDYGLIIFKTYCLIKLAPKGMLLCSSSKVLHVITETEQSVPIHYWAKC